MGANWKFHRHYLFIDLEATCALDSGIARAERETIEIGAVAIDAASGEAIGSFQEYIRPVQHPKLTAFTNSPASRRQRSKRQHFFRMYSRVSRPGSTVLKTLFFAWGHYDKKQLIIDCRRHQIQYTLPAGFLDFKGLFYKKQKLLKRSGLRATLQQVGLRFEGRPHGALADARNTARLWRFVSEEGKKIHQKN